MNLDAPRSLPFLTDAHVTEALPTAIAHVRTGGMLAHPTETVYGIGSAVESHVLQKLTTLKARGEPKPFVLLISALSMLTRITLAPSRHAAALATRFWPGALTLVLPPAEQVPEEARGPTGGVAVRWTSHPGMQRLIAALGAPLSSTSANLAGLPPARTALEIAAQWPREIAAGELRVLDGGSLPTGSPSTIVDCTGPLPRVVRIGTISVDALRATIPELA